MINDDNIYYVGKVGHVNCNDETWYPESIVSIDIEANYYGYGETSKKYELDDCVLVRTTDIFPFDGIVQTPINGDSIIKNYSNIWDFPVLEVLKKKYSREELAEESKKFHLFFKCYRSTIHFTLNGLVSSHLYGNFSGRPYVIIEPLKHHISDSSLCSLSPHDTYFNDDMMLSEEAILIISEEVYNKIKNNPIYFDTLSRLKIYVYHGKNQNEAVAKVLNHEGYDCLLISNLGYSKSLESKTNYYVDGMTSSINNLRSVYGVDSISHFGSEYMSHDTDLEESAAKNVELEHLYYVLEKSNISDELRNKIINLIVKNMEGDTLLSEHYFDNTEGILDVMVELVNSIGLDNLVRFTQEFNDMLLSRWKKGTGLKI